MTLQPSGTMNMTQIRDELRRPAGYALTFPEQETRWLADLPAGSMTIPTHFYSKQGVKLVGVTGLDGAATTSHVFGGVGFGLEYPNRTLTCVFMCLNKPSAAIPTSLTFSGVSVGGVAIPDGGFVWAQGGSGSAMMMGLRINSVVAPGTSGTIAFTTNVATQSKVYVLSLANVPPGPAMSDNHSTGAASLSASTNMPDNGVQVTAAMGFGSPVITWANATDRIQEVFGGYRLSITFDNRLAAEPGRPVIANFNAVVPCILGDLAKG
ncbi:MAG: hypothetical protein ABS35_15450 [Kaistia sp. SCN 65-12]|nr:MAG: hypothetical protein ABS35_15450 [Kaistia sp. SCN 65-12]